MLAAQQLSDDNEDDKNQKVEIVNDMTAGFLGEQCESE